MAAKEPTTQNPSQSYGMADIRVLAKILNQYDLSEVEVEHQGQRVKLRRDRGMVLSPTTTPHSIHMAMPIPASAPIASAEASAGAASAKPKDDGTNLITSPFVGTFYRAPSPESPPFVEVGQTVQKGKVLCIVEAMKLMNEIETETTCKIVDILVKNAEPVEFGQPLFKVLPIA